jgi:hypothetical protein
MLTDVVQRLSGLIRRNEATKKATVPSLRLIEPDWARIIGHEVPRVLIDVLRIATNAL